MRSAEMPLVRSSHLHSQPINSETIATNKAACTKNKTYGSLLNGDKKRFWRQQCSKTYKVAVNNAAKVPINAIVDVLNGNGRTLPRCCEGVGYHPPPCLETLSCIIYWLCIIVRFLLLKRPGGLFDD